MHEYMRNEIYELLLVWDLGGRAVFSALYVRALFLLGGGGWKVIRPEITIRRFLIIMPDLFNDPGFYTSMLSLLEPTI